MRAAPLSSSALVALPLALFGAGCSSLWGFDDLRAGAPGDDGGTTIPSTGAAGGSAVDGGQDVRAEVDAHASRPSDGSPGNDAAVSFSDAAQAARVVFISSATFTGDLGGLDGADAQCQRLASDAHLTGTFKAWLSDSKTWAASRLTHGAGPYVLVNGIVVANDWSGLTSGTLLHAVDITESGGAAPQASLGPGESMQDCTSTSCLPMAWSGTGPTGIGDGASYLCNDWSSSSTGVYGAWGAATKADGNWSDEYGPQCDDSAAIYCVEQ
jgi:hypothetical protein